MPAGFNRAFDANVYFSAKNNPSAPANYKPADYRFMIIIGDGDSSTTVNLVQEAIRSNALDEVFVLGVSGNGFAHDASVPNLPSAHIPPPIVPNSMADAGYGRQEQALVNIATVFTDAVYAAAAPNSLNSSSTMNDFSISWPTKTMSTDVSHYNYYYADQDSIAAAAFQDMATKIVAQVGPPATGIYAQTTLGNGFALYNYPGKPMFEQVGQVKADGSGDTWNQAGQCRVAGEPFPGISTRSQTMAR